MFYEDVFRGLNKAKIRFAVTGGVAMVLYGGVRRVLESMEEDKDRNG
jgi:hypothetical protein